MSRKRRVVGPVERRDDPEVTVEAIFGEDYLPQVQLRIEYSDGEANLYLPPEDALLLGARILETAQQAVFEAALVEQLAAGGMTLGAIGVFVRELREAQSKFAGTSWTNLPALLPHWQALAAAGLKLPGDEKP